MTDGRYDCIVVGGGPAGLSAALLLGRSRRRVLVCDTGLSRNRWASGVRGFLTREDVPPQELLRLARVELARYPTVEYRPIEVTDAERCDGGFAVTLADGARLACRKLLLATGVVDELPRLENFEQFYGRSAHHCPYCDGYEHRDEPTAVYAPGGEPGRGLALTLRLVWTDDVVLCSDGPAHLSPEHREELRVAGVPVVETPLVRLEGEGGRLERLVFADGSALARRAFFFATGQRMHSGLAERLGCRFTEAGVVDTGNCEATNVPGLYVAGDASKETQFVSVAVAEGTQAGFAVNRDLVKEDLAAMLG